MKFHWLIFKPGNNFRENWCHKTTVFLESVPSTLHGCMYAKYGLFLQLFRNFGWNLNFGLFQATLQNKTFFALKYLILRLIRYQR